MIPRAAIPTRVVVDLFIAQNGICPLCKKKLLAGQPRITEHTPARALLVANGVTNPDDPKYLSIVHKECAALKTRGCEGESNKHSVADGDTHKIAKAERHARGGKTVRHPMPKIDKPIAKRADPWGKEYRAKRAQQ